MRARLALRSSRTVCELREIKLKAKPAEMIAVSPKATVPVLVLPDDRVIDESLDIMHWALGSNDPEDWLAGDDKDLIAANDGPFKHHLDRYKYPNRHATDPVEHRAAGLALLEHLEGRLAKHPYLCGDAMTLTDAAILPFVRQFAETDRIWFDAQPIPHVQAWLAKFLNSAQFEAVMIRPDPWAPGDAALLFGTD